MIRKPIKTHFFDKCKEIYMRVCFYKAQQSVQKALWKGLLNQTLSNKYASHLKIGLTRGMLAPLASTITGYL